MRCAYCFYADVARRREVASYGRMTPETCEALIRKAFFYAADGASCTFGFQGGEPTLAGLDYYKGFVMLQRAYNRANIGVNYTIQTNGYKLGAEWAHFFAENNFLVGLSIDGIKSVHDAYRRGADGGGTYGAVLETAEILSEFNVNFNILCVVNDAVASRPGEVYAALRKYKFLQFIPCLDDIQSPYKTDAAAPSAQIPRPSLTPDKYAGFLKTVFDMYYQDYMRGEFTSIRVFDNYVNMLLGYPPEQCGMNGFCNCYFLVEADGSVYPCDFYVLDEWRLGNVNETSLARMMKSETAARFVAMSRDQNPDCLRCEWRCLCNGGCRRYREQTGATAAYDINTVSGERAVSRGLGKNILCGAYKDFFDYAYDKLKQIAETQSRKKR
jgi:uncharacterized protein